MFTADDVTALKRAIATGAYRVRHSDGREITYRSQSELERALSLAERGANPTAAAEQRSFVAEF